MGNHFIDQPQRQGLLGSDRFPRQDQFQGLFPAGYPRQYQGGDGRKDPYLDFRLSELGLFRGQDQVAVQSQLTTASKAAP